MGGYSTALYLGLALGSCALGPSSRVTGMRRGLGWEQLSCSGRHYCRGSLGEARNDRCEPLAV